MKTIYIILEIIAVLIIGLGSYSFMNRSRTDDPVEVFNRDIGKVVTYKGTAENSTVGAILAIRGVVGADILIEGLKSWPANFSGKEVFVTGKLTRKSSFNNADTQSKRLIFEQPIWNQTQNLLMETRFKSAIDQDDPEAIDAVIRTGATANERWEAGTTPVEYSVARYKKKALAELFKNGGDPNLRDDEGDNAVTLAVRTYAKDPEILAMVLKAGGNPDTKRSDNDPVIVRFINDRNIDGIKFMAKAGADINARNRSGRPLIIYSGIIEYWDVTWCLLQLGAHYSYPGEAMGWAEIFNTPDVTPPDSSLWQYKAKAWEFLTKKGIKLPPLQ